MPEKDKYSRMVENILGDVKKRAKELNESRITYDENTNERMAPELELALRRREHSLGADHPALPDGHEQHFEEKIMSERFKDVVKNAKKHFNTDHIDAQMMMTMQLPLVKDCMVSEKKHKKKLEKLAVEMIMEEFEIPEGLVEFHAELTDRISLEGTKKNPNPVAVDEVQFDNHQGIKDANAEVYKRRLINTMIQGAAKKNHHMFHMVDDELADMDPRLPNLYAKTMAAADYMYYVINKMDNQVAGGVVRVEFPKKAGEPIRVYAQALIFPVLIHELAKGVMEVLSAHGLPRDKKMQKFVIGKADFLGAEPWDMRLGPALWERFTKTIDPKDFNLKHHIYMELVKLPVNEFNDKMKEIFAGTKEGKKIVDDIATTVKNDIKNDEFNEALENKRNEFKKDSFINPDDINGLTLEDFGI